MILPWAHRLTQPGRTVCVVIRASPLIWPTLFGATHAPRPLFMVTPAGFFLAGLWVLGGASPLSAFGCDRDGRQRSRAQTKKAPIG
jgi:hypothetical protein